MRCTPIGFRAIFLNFTTPLICCYFHGNVGRCQTKFTKQVSESRCSQFSNRTTDELKETQYNERHTFQRYYSSPEMNYQKLGDHAFGLVSVNITL